MNGSKSRSISALRGPRSPEKTTRFVRPSSSTRSWMLAEPSMWPDSAQIAWMPGATSNGFWYGTGRSREMIASASSGV